jgi:hypothetical protein
MSLRNQTGTYIVAVFTDIYLYRYFTKFLPPFIRCHSCKKYIYSELFIFTRCLECETMARLLECYSSNIFYIKIAWQPQQCCVCNNSNGVYYLSMTNRDPWWDFSENHFCSFECMDAHYALRDSYVVRGSTNKIQINTWV